jgi:hypothetical protein
MFVIEWQRDGKTIKREAMLGTNFDAALEVAREGVPQALAESGSEPDAIRIHDAARNTITVHKLGEAHGRDQRARP